MNRTKPPTYSFTVIYYSNTYDALQNISQVRTTRLTPSKKGKAIKPVNRPLYLILFKPGGGGRERERAREKNK